MNDNFDFSFEPQPQFMMTPEEEKSHKKIFSRLGLALFVYVAVGQGLAFAASYLLYYINPALLYDNNLWIIVSSVIQYVIMFPIFYLIIRRLPKRAPEKARMGGKRFFQLIFIGVFFMYVGNYVSQIIMQVVSTVLGNTPENSVNTLLDSTNIIFTILFAGIIGPIFEELIFRKLFIDRLAPYGEKIAILFPALAFGLFHGNFYQCFYAFLLGIILSYIYLKTGKIIYSIILHVFVNLFFGVFSGIVFSLVDYETLMNSMMTPEFYEEIMNISMYGSLMDIITQLGPLFLFLIYVYGQIAMVVLGIVFFFKNRKKTVLKQGEVVFPKGVAGEVIFLNIGVILFTVVCYALMAYSLF